jgi:hypothetical protein
VGFLHRCNFTRSWTQLVNPDGSVLYLWFRKKIKRDLIIL